MSEEAKSDDSHKPRRRRCGLLLRYGLRRARNHVQIERWPGVRLFRETSRENKAADAKAGLNVALLAFPQSIAYSLIAGLPPQAGLFSSAIGAMVGPIFSGSRFIVQGASNASAILVYSGLIAAGLTEDRFLMALPVFVVLTGLFQVIGALVQFSQVLSYVSRTVITGYVTAAAALIFVHQFQNALGFKVGSASTFFAVLWGTVRHLGETRWPEALMSLGTLAFYLGCRRWYPRWPHVAVTMFVMSLVALGFRYIGWELAYLSGFSVHNLAILHLDFDFELIGRLTPPALAVAFMAILEGSSVGKALAARSGERLNINQELYGLGMANLGSALFGGMVSSGSLTRSVLSINSGARTGLATFYGGAFVLILLFSLGYFIGWVPKAALAVIVMCIAISLFDRRQIRLALGTTRSDGIVFAVTCVSALIMTLDMAIYLGALTSALLFIRKAATPELVEYGFNPQGQLAEVGGATRQASPGISILHAEGDLFFGSADIFDQQMREVMRDPNLQVVILRLKNARNLDASAAAGIEELLDFLRSSGRHLLLSGADREVARVFRNSGLLAKLGPENFFREVPANPTMATRNALQRAQALIGRNAEVRIFVDQNRDKKSSGRA